MFTRFFDMHSGGYCKENGKEYIYIEAPAKEAIIIFYNRFGHNPHRVTCTCCGEDYGVIEYETLETATEFDRKRNNFSLDEYVKREDVLVIYASEIESDERIGEVPTQGYVYL